MWNLLPPEMTHQSWVRSHCVFVRKWEERKPMIHPSVLVLICTPMIIQPKINRRTCANWKTNQTSFGQIMMPQWCLCSHTEQLGQREPTKCKNSFKGTEVCPRFAAASLERGCQARLRCQPLTNDRWGLRNTTVTVDWVERAHIHLQCLHRCIIHFSILRRKIIFINWWVKKIKITDVQKRKKEEKRIDGDILKVCPTISPLWKALWWTLQHVVNN